MVQHLKAELRKKMLALRESIGAEERKAMGVEACRRLAGLPRFRDAASAAFYVPIKNELDVLPLMLEAAKTKEIFLPATASDHHLELRRFESLGKLKKGRFGILEPETQNTKANAPAHEPDVIVVPGVAFGLCMHRLGYGRGYYDRLLSTLPSFRIGICYDFQVVEKLPSHEDDERMDLILTEKRRIAMV